MIQVSKLEGNMVFGRGAMLVLFHCCVFVVTVCNGDVIGYEEMGWWLWRDVRMYKSDGVCLNSWKIVLLLNGMVTDCCENVSIHPGTVNCGIDINP